MTFNERIAKFLGAKKPIGFETINITSAVAVGLNIPAVANPKNRVYYAICALESDPGAIAEVNAVKAVHFTEHAGGVPTAASGMPLSNGSVYEIQGYDQLVNFKIIGVTAGRTHKLQVTYYQLGDQ